MISFYFLLNSKEFDHTRKILCVNLHFHGDTLIYIQYLYCTSVTQYILYLFPYLVILGIGKIHDRYCLVSSSDGTVKSGTFFPITVTKNLRFQEICTINRLPAVAIVDSAGGFLPLQVSHVTLTILLLPINSSSILLLFFPCLSHSYLFFEFASTLHLLLFLHFFPCILDLTDSINRWTVKQNNGQYPLVQNVSTKCQAHREKLCISSISNKKTCIPGLERILSALECCATIVFK